VKTDNEELQYSIPWNSPVDILLLSGSCQSNENTNETRSGLWLRNKIHISTMFGVNDNVFLERPTRDRRDDADDNHRGIKP